MIISLNSMCFCVKVLYNTAVIIAENLHSAKIYFGVNENGQNTCFLKRLRSYISEYSAFFRLFLSILGTLKSK